MASEQRRQFTVSAFWDEEAEVWVADSDDIPGLVTEAHTIEELDRKLRDLVPELLELNGHLVPGYDPEQPVSFELTARKSVPVQRHAA